jgi:S1-C subfamily serine protease
VLVTAVEPRGPADSAGIKPGDLIVSVDKMRVADTDQLAIVLAQVNPGTTIPVQVVRKGKKLTIDVKVGQLKSP